jgi:thiamine-monophosphate kinase
VELERLPVSDDTRELAISLGRDPGVLAAGGGEDYELLISAPEQVLGDLAGAVETPVTVVGEVTESGIAFRRGSETVGDLSGWDHFA